jgi:hypothetical protein
MASFLKILSAFTRLVCLAFLVFAALAILEAMELLQDGYTFDEDDGTLYVPLQTCEPEKISIGGSTVLIDFDDDDDTGGQECHTLDYLVMACGFSYVFAAAAVISFFVFDALARCGVGPINRSTVLGMALFMFFILVQCAACSWGLAQECRFWEDYLTKVYKDITDTEQVEEVKTYANPTWYLVAGGVALGAAFLLLLDASLNFCCGTATGSNKANTDSQASVKTTVPPTTSAPAPNGSDSSSEAMSIPDSQPANSPPWSKV